MTATPWMPFYWADYVADTGHLSLAQHGAYLLLMAHYYRTGKPLPANASILHRICRCTTEPDKVAVEQVVTEFFTGDGDVYRHRRIDAELAKAADISRKRQSAAEMMHAKRAANANAIAEQVHTQSQPQSQPQAKAKAFVHPTLDEVRSYCRERKNAIDPEQWFSFYQSNGWRVGRNSMKDWRASIRTWERNGVGYARGNIKENRAEQRTVRNLAALEAAFPLAR